jgi:hypothetical protein
MRLVVAICATLSIAIGSASGADAQSSANRKGRKHATRSVNSTAGGYQSGTARRPTASSSDWYPHDTSQLPFGSKQWWDQKSRESGGDHN